MTELSRRVQRAETTVRERVAALENDGIIRGYRTLIDPAAFGYKVRAWMRADCDPSRLSNLASLLAPIPEVLRVDYVTGRRPLRIEFLTRSPADVERIVQKRIGPLELRNPEIFMVLQELVTPRPLPVSDALLGNGDGAPSREDPATRRFAPRKGSPVVEELLRPK